MSSQPVWLLRRGRRKLLEVSRKAFAIAIVVQASTGMRTLSPRHSLAEWTGYVANIITVGAGLFAGLLTFMGALRALKGEP